MPIARALHAAGAMFDRNYSTSIGWRGIRVRRENLQRILRQAIDDLHRLGRPVQHPGYCIRAGPVRLETMKALPDAVYATAVLRDYQQANLDAAGALARELKLSERVQIIHGDAFDRAHCQRLTQTTISIRVGPVRIVPGERPGAPLTGRAGDAVDPAGYLDLHLPAVHPQVEFIARALVNVRGSRGSCGGAPRPRWMSWCARQA